MRVINTIYESARTGRAMRIKPVPKRQRPDEMMKIKRPPVKKPEVVEASSPHPE